MERPREREILHMVNNRSGENPSVENKETRGDMDDKAGQVDG
jgi:hypothetical protein